MQQAKARWARKVTVGFVHAQWTVKVLSGRLGWGRSDWELIDSDSQYSPGHAKPDSGVGDSATGKVITVFCRQGV